MTIELPKDVEGREIPLDTTKLFGASGDAYNITRWIYTTDFYASNDVAGQWRAATDTFERLDPELMYLTPPDNPTCRNLSNDYRSFHCSRCGYKAFTYGDSDCDPEDFTYCPECRAEVVDE